jgi:hypothetical protein
MIYKQTRKSRYKLGASLRNLQNTTSNFDVQTHEHTTLVIRLFPSPPNGLGQILYCDLFSAGEISGGDLGVDFDS